MGSAWQLYDELIEGIGAGERVLGMCEGSHWTCVEASCGTGVAATCKGGQRQRLSPLAGKPLRDVAALAKSWDFETASIGVAAINAWYNQPERLHGLAGARLYADSGSRPCAEADPFVFLPGELEEFERREGRRARVVVVGRFPRLERIAQIADLSVLERARRADDDLPDTACEYVLPEADFAIVTGMAESNKTLPRLLELASGAYTIVVGPSATIAPALLCAGAARIAGSCVADGAAVRSHIECGSSPLRSGGLTSASLFR